MGRFEVYGSIHTDGDALLMIRNGHVCRAIYKTSDHVYIDKLRTKVWNEVSGAKSKLDVYIRYYRLAHKLDLHSYRVPWCN
jgi:hypothetical protein